MLSLNLGFFSLGYAQTYSTNGSASQQGPGCYRLVNGTNQAGSVWNNSQINLNNPFDFTFQVYMDHPTNPNSPAGDGIAFVLQNSSSGTGALSNAGSGIGYAQPPGGVSGPISPSFAVELDIWGNGGGILDMAGGVHHVACHVNGSITTIAAGPVAARVGNLRLDDGVCRSFRIKWVPNGDSLFIWYDDVPRMIITYNVDSLFGATPNVYWGLTSGSGTTGPGLITACWDFAAAGADAGICSDSTLVLSGSGGNSYSWTDLNGNVPAWLSGAGTASPTAISVPSGQNSLEMTVTNSPWGCTEKDTMVIESDPVIPSADAGPDSTFCSSQLINLYANNPSPGLGVWTFVSGSLTPTIAQNLNETSPLTGWNGGPFPVTMDLQWTISSTAFGHCPTTRDTVTVSVLQAPTANAGGNDTICSGNTISLNGSGVGGQVYNWSPPQGLSNPADPASDLTLANSGPNHFSILPYYFTVTDTASGCTATDSISIFVADPPEFVFAKGKDTTFCRKDTMTIQLDSMDFWFDTILWTPSAGLINFPLAGQVYDASPDSTTTYLITLLDQTFGCAWSDSITIQYSNVGLDGLFDRKICLGDTIRLNVLADSMANDIFWTAGTGGYIEYDTMASPRVAPSITQDYYVVIIDTSGICDPGTGTILVEVQDLSLNLAGEPINGIAFPGQVVINPAQTADLSSELTFTIASSFSYAWTGLPSIACPTCPNTSVTPPAQAWNEGDGTIHPYTLLITDDSIPGCEVEQTINVLCDVFEAPNVFTPNGDGFNDLLYVNYHGPMEYKSAIFDRWGRKIYSTENKQVNWDGNDPSGNPVNEGVYYLVIDIETNQEIESGLLIPEGKDNDGRNRVYAVTLLR